VPARHAAVVGAGGFVGRRLVAALCHAGIPATGYTRDHPLTGPGDHDIVFYLATSITPAAAEARPDLVEADHARYGRLLDTLAAAPDPPAVVLTSSAGTVYQPDVPGPCRETHPLRPTCRYGDAKLALERRLSEYPGPGTVLRLSNVYGAGQPAKPGQGVLAHWMAAAARGEPLRLIGDPGSTRDYVHVDDVAEAMVRVAYRPRRPLVLNIARGHSTSLGDLLAAVRRAVGRPVEVIPEPARGVDRRESSLDVTRARAALGWRARVPLRAGIAGMWAATAHPGFHEPASSRTAHASSQFRPLERVR
jgi:UDP-glucose 4-epimerase